jgi:TetR/AcrR family transcriptional repressor of nem operon
MRVTSKRRPSGKSSVRAKILAAAVDRFHALGYTACGVQEIIQAAGVPKGSFYNHFKTKDSLAREVLDLYWNKLDIEILRINSTPPLTRLHHHFKQIGELYEDWGFERGCLVGKFIQESSNAETPLLFEYLSQSVSSWIELIARTVAEGQADGSISKAIEAPQLARVITFGWGGAAAGMKMAKSRVPLDDFFAIVFSLLYPSTAEIGKPPHTHKKR